MATLILSRLRKAGAKARLTPKVRTRLARPEDVDEIIEVELSAWGCEGAATPDKILSRIRTYPEGQRVAIVMERGEERIIGFVSTMRLTSAQVHNLKSWSQMTGDGYISNHSPNGVYLYGVDLSVHDSYARRGVGNLLLAEIAAMVIREGIRYALLGGRLPGLREYNEKRERDGFPPTEAAEYMELRREDGKLLDPELRFYMSIWFMETIGVLPNYFPDPDSLDNGVLLRWSNPLYRWFCGFGLLYRLPGLGRPIVELVARVVKLML